MKMIKRESGFTLIEIVATLVIIGILSVFAGMFIISGLKGYLFAKENASLSQKAQLAMSRINRELMELSNVTAASGISVTYQRLWRDGNPITRTINFSNGSVRLDGTTLINNVSSFALSYWKGPNAWAFGEDIQLLSAIKVDMTLARQDGSGYVSFSTTLNPRNNKNYGGAPQNLTPPSVVGFCFIATAVYDNYDHPAVMVLRQFRDKFLLTWDGGRSVVAEYYRIGPFMAEEIRANGLLKAGFRTFLVPVVGMAYLLVNAPGGLILIILSSILLTIAFRRAFSRASAPMQAQKGSVLVAMIISILIFASIGAAMLSLMSTSAMSEIGGNSSTRAYYLAESGYRFAANQYLNAGSEAQRDAMLETLHSTVPGNMKYYTLGSGQGKFYLEVFPYYYQVPANSSGTTLVTKVFGGLPLVNGDYKNGSMLQIKKPDLTVVYPTISGAVCSGSTVTFTLNSNTNVPANSYVVPACVTTNSTVTKGGNLNISTTTPANAFPLKNGIIIVKDSAGKDRSLSYESLDLTTGAQKFMKLTEPGNSGFNTFSMSSNKNVILRRYARVRSTGIFAEGSPAEAKRSVTFFSPLGEPSSSTKTQYQDTFDNLDNWFTGNNQEIGDHTISGGALNVSSSSVLSWGGIDLRWSILNFNWSNSGVNLDASWRSAAYTDGTGVRRGLLSYDMQIKCRVDDQSPARPFMLGLSFRVIPVDPTPGDPGSGDEDMYQYGISFMRAQQTKEFIIFLVNEWRSSGYLSGWDFDGIRNELVPGECMRGAGQKQSNTPCVAGQSCADCAVAGLYDTSLRGDYDGMITSGSQRYSNPAIVLWQRTSAGFKWLAYKILGSNDVLAEGNNHVLRQWSTIFVRVIEALPLNFTNGIGIGADHEPILHDQTIVGASSGAVARVQGTPILTTGGSWLANNAAGILTVTNVLGTFQNGENLLVNGTVRARVNGTIGTKTNFIRAYYSDVNNHTPLNADPRDNNRGANVRINSSSDIMRWPVDNVSKWEGFDYMTLVKWDGWNAGVAVLGDASSLEPRAVVMDDTLLSPDDSVDSNIFNRSEIAIHTHGEISHTDYWFDDFGIQVDTVGSGQGFLPPIQQ